jgi:hypothetical protein
VSNLTQWLAGQRPKWSNYVLCLLFHLLLPLIPLLFEWLATRQITESSLTLTAALYAMTIGLSSRYKLSFGVALIISIVFAFGFGWVASITSGQTIMAHKDTVPPMIADPIQVKQYCIWAITVVLGLQIIERFIRHVLNAEPFWELFSK